MCHVCKVQVTVGNRASHERGFTHQAKELMERFRTHGETLSLSKNGVEVTSSLGNRNNPTKTTTGVFPVHRDADVRSGVFSEVVQGNNCILCCTKAKALEVLTKSY
jgi:hypothetical protein